jgi:hypothetical protein
LEDYYTHKLPSLSRAIGQFFQGGNALSTTDQGIGVYSSKLENRQKPKRIFNHKGEFEPSVRGAQRKDSKGRFLLPSCTFVSFVVEFLQYLNGFLCPGK